MVNAIQTIPIYNKYIELLLERKNNYLEILADEFDINKAEVKKVLADAKTIKYFEPHLKKLLSHSSIDKLRLLEEVKSIAFSNISNYVSIVDDAIFFKDWHTMPKEQLAAIKSIEQVETKSGDKTYKISFWDKQAALAILLKMSGQLEDKLIVSGEVSHTHRLFDNINEPINSVNSLPALEEVPKIETSTP